MRFSSGAALVLLAFAAAASPAGATEEDGKTFFAQGRRLRTDGNCTEAIVAFRRALEVFPQGLGALRNIAECEEQLGQFASARNDWWSLRRAVLQSNEPKYEGWEKDAEQGYNRLADKVAKLTVRVHGVDPVQVHIAIDGKPLDPRLVGVELERDLGPHTIEGFYGGVSPVIEKRTLAAGSREVVTLKIPAPRGPDSVTPLPPAGMASGAPASPPHSSVDLRVVGGVALGAGGLGAIGMVIAIVVRQEALNKIDETCKSHEGCSLQLMADRDRGQTASTLANVFGGLAIAGIGAGVTLMFVGSRSPSSARPPPSASAKLSLVPLREGAAAQFTMRF